MSGRLYANSKAYNATVAIGEVMITATVTFPGVAEFAEFLSVLYESELSQPNHQKMPSQVIRNNTGIVFSMFLCIHVDFLIKASLETGMLHRWGTQCVLTETPLGHAQEV